MGALAIRTHWSHGRSHRAGMDALAIRMHWSHGRYHRAGSGHSHALVAQTLSSCGHGCSWPFARTGHTDVIIVRAWMLMAIRTHWSRGRCHRTGMPALAIRTHWSHRRYHRAGRAAHGHSHALVTRTLWVLWPFARTGRTEVLIVRAWMLWPFAALVTRALSSCGLWPFARTGRTDVIIVRAWMLMAIRTHWSHGRYHRASMDAHGHSHALVTRTLSSCGHGCSGHSHALVARTLSSCGHGCSGHSHALVTRALSSCGLWPFARTGRTDVIIVRAWLLWPFARTGHADVIIVRAWLLWPFARTGALQERTATTKVARVLKFTKVARTQLGHGASTLAGERNRVEGALF